MKFAFNPAAAYRQHGRRYSIYVFMQLAVTLGLLALALITAWGAFIGLETTDTAYQIGMHLVQWTSLGMIYVALEFVHWKVRFYRARRAIGLTANKTRA